MKGYLIKEENFDTLQKRIGEIKGNFTITQLEYVNLHYIVVINPSADFTNIMKDSQSGLDKLTEMMNNLKK